MQAVRHLRGPPSTSLPGPGLGDWPRERRASSPEQPGRSPVGERLGQSQFLCWALDGTDGRRFKGSSGWAGRTKGCRLSKGGCCRGECVASSIIPRGYPLHGVAPRHCPAAPPHIPSCPAEAPPVLQGSWVTRQGLWHPCPCLLDTTNSSPSSGSLPRPRKDLLHRAALYLAQTASKRGHKSSLGGPVLFHCEAAPWSSASRIINSTLYPECGERHQGPGTPSVVPLGSSQFWGVAAQHLSFALWDDGAKEGST